MPCIRICKLGQTNGFEELRKGWDEWDLRVLILYILFTQLYLHIFGRLRRKSTIGMMSNVHVWAFYLLVDVLATIALGKLSKVKDNDDIKPMSRLRGLWAPIILFFLGGPDSMTILRLEENKIWLKHVIGLFVQGIRAAFVLYVTWTSPYQFSLLALLMLFPGLIKYGERVWVIKSRGEGKYDGYIQIDQSTIDKQRPNSKLVLQAYSWSETLRLHIPNYKCDRQKLHKLVNELNERGHNTFKLIEIELGLMYDMLFSKVGTIFTIWGSILRFISFSCMIIVLVGFFLFEKPHGHLPADIPITIILLVGALFLEIAGVLMQFGSDWAIVWACKQYPSKLATLVFHLHEHVISKSKRWSELMGQFSLLNFCNKNKPKQFNIMAEALCGRETMWKKSCLPVTSIEPSLKKLIINRLFEKSQNISEVDTLQASTIKGVEKILEKYEYLDSRWIIELQFDESIVIWHVATDICYHLQSEDSTTVTNEVKDSKILSYYMMYILFICRSSLPCSNDNTKFMQAYAKVKEIFDGFVSSNAKPYKLLLEKESNPNNQIVNNIQKLVCGLMEKENRWKIMSDVWVEMLCYAARHCPMKNHIQELRHGGQFLTHIWLLLIHLGVARKLEKNKSEKLKVIDKA